VVDTVFSTWLAHDQHHQLALLPAQAAVISLNRAYGSGKCANVAVRADGCCVVFLTDQDVKEASIVRSLALIHPTPTTLLGSGPNVSAFTINAGSRWIFCIWLRMEGDGRVELWSALGVAVAMAAWLLHSITPFGAASPNMFMQS
jgi:hypothetical protein